MRKSGRQSRVGLLETRDSSLNIIRSLATNDWRTFIDAREIPFHIRIREQRSSKPKLTIQPMSITSGKREAAQSLKLRMSNHRSQELFAIAIASMFWKHENVYEV